MKPGMWPTDPETAHLQPDPPEPPPVPNRYVDEDGTHYGHCNACGEEGNLFGSCPDPECVDGEMVPYDDDPDPDA